MNFIYRLKKKAFSVKGSRENQFLIGSATKGWLNLNLDLSSSSRYQGWFIPFDNEFIKIIDEIKINSKINQIEYSSQRVKFYLENNSLEIEINNGELSFLSKNLLEIEIYFDIKKIFSEQNWGKIYRIEKIKENIWRVYFFQEKENYQINLSLYFEGEINFPQKWTKKEYLLDKKRNSHFWENWTFLFLKGKIKKLVFQVEGYKYYPTSVITFKNENLWDFLLSGHLNTLSFKGHFLAGLPWFCQIWPRDELISLFLIGDKIPKIAKRIVESYLLNTEEIFFQTKKENPPSGVDSFLWLWVNVDKLFQKGWFTFPEVYSWVKKREKFFNYFIEAHLKNGLIRANDKETWMDSLYREYPIEVQFLFLRALCLFEKITKDTYWNYLKNQLVLRLRKFFVNSYLKDDLTSNQLRPNFMLGYFLMPQLFSKEEWERFFENALAKLFLQWGGIATLDISDEKFVSSHSGENPISYHQGDSWFWINNLFGLALLSVNSKKYREKAYRLFRASLKEIFTLGLLGFSGELSSANQLTSEGNFLQLWSIVSFYQLANQINPEPKFQDLFEIF